MKNFSRLDLILILFLLLASCNSSHKTESDFTVTAEEINNKPVPQLNEKIVDSENIFDSESKNRILKSISDFENATTCPAIVHTTANIDGYETFTEYADNISNKWNYCKDNNGILFVLSAKLGEVRVISCDNTNKKISESDYEKLFNDILYENFRANNFDQGIIDAIEFLTPIISEK